MNGFSTRTKDAPPTAGRTRRQHRCFYRPDLGHAARSNRLAQETVRGVTYVFNNNGARQSAAVGGFFEEKYWYDGLGRTSGVAELGPGPKLGPNRCRYDPDGQLYRRNWRMAYGVSFRAKTDLLPERPYGHTP